MESLVEGSVVAIRAVASGQYVARDGEGRFGPFAASPLGPEAQFRVAFWRDGEGDWATFQCLADNRLLSLVADDDDPVSLTPGMPPARSLFRLADEALACRGGGFAGFERPSGSAWRFWAARRPGGTYTYAENVDACRVRVEILSRPAPVAGPVAPSPHADGSVVAIRCLDSGHYLRAKDAHVLADAADFAAPAARFRLHKSEDEGGERVAFTTLERARGLVLHRRGARLVLAARGSSGEVRASFRLDGAHVLSTEHGGWLAVAPDGDVEVRARASEASRFALVSVQAEEVFERLRVEAARVREGVSGLPRRPNSP